MTVGVQDANGEVAQAGHGAGAVPVPSWDLRAAYLHAGVAAVTGMVGDGVLPSTATARRHAGWGAAAAGRQRGRGAGPLRGSGDAR